MAVSTELCPGVSASVNGRSFEMAKDRECGGNQSSQADESRPQRGRSSASAKGSESRSLRGSSPSGSMKVLKYWSHASTFR